MFVQINTFFYVRSLKMLIKENNVIKEIQVNNITQVFDFAFSNSLFHFNFDLDILNTYF